MEQSHGIERWTSVLQGPALASELDLGPHQTHGDTVPPGMHLIGAYGIHWSRKEVNWHPGPGRSWQMLGRVSAVRPGLRICDFRFAAGVYVLERRGHPVYAGLARSDMGFGSRLKNHTTDETKDWTHFSWFSFDDVLHSEHRVTYPDHPDGWAYIEPRETLAKAQMQAIVGELEALLVNLMIDTSLVNIQRPRFPSAAMWTQITKQNNRSPGICHRVDREAFVDKRPFG